VKHSEPSHLNFGSDTLTRMSNPKPHPRHASAQVSEAISVATSAGEVGIAADAFFELWLPFEMEIGHLTGQWASDALEVSASLPTGAKYLEARRRALEAVFAQAESGEALATQVSEALGVVLRKFAQSVAGIVERGEANEDEEPGRLALRELARDAEFAREASAYSSLLQKWLISDFARQERPSSRGSLVARRTVSLGPVALFLNDAVHGMAVRALSRPQDWEAREELAYAFHGQHSKASVTIGLRQGKDTQELWEYLRGGGARLVKAHYALWARYYEDIESHGLRYATISVPQFCADIGLKKHRNGGFRREQKQEAMRLLRGLTSIEMCVEKTIGAKALRLRGPLWARGLDAEERDVYDDMLGQAREGDPEQWEPVAFSFAPGPWFSDADWMSHHRFLGKVGSGLLRLDNREEWAVLIGGYLATLGRANKYKPLRARAGLILSRSGLAQTESAKRRLAENRKKFESAMDRLCEPEIAVLSAWRFEGIDTSEPDMDDAESLAEYADINIYPPGDWRGWIVEIDLPFQEDANRLQVTREKAQAKAASRRKRRPLAVQPAEGSPQ
jgi:hypothetical protein